MCININNWGIQLQLSYTNLRTYYLVPLRCYHRSFIFLYHDNIWYPCHIVFLERVLNKSQNNYKSITISISVNVSEKLTQ